jgi:hypothetical protein
MVIKNTYLAILLLLMLALTFSGCGVPQKEYDALEAQLASTQREYDATKSKLASAQSDLAAAQNEAKKVQGELASQSATLAQMRSSNDALQKQVSELESKLNAILDTKVVQYYNFSFQFDRYDWTLAIPLRTYFYYKDQTRPAVYSKYSPMATDSYADSLLNILVRNLEDAALANELRKIDVVNLVATFIQTLPHTDSDVTTPYDLYPRYPLETLFEQGGDSEDTSILAAALLVREGYDVVLFIFEQQKHMAVGVNIPAVGGYGWEYQGNNYFYLETTGEKWQLGDCPTEYWKGRPSIFPVGR